MKEVMTFVARVLGTLFAVCIVAYTSYLTYQLGKRIVPDDAPTPGNDRLTL